MPMATFKPTIRAGDWLMKKAVKHGGISNPMPKTKNGPSQ
jgi:hypothetical protein